MKIISNLVIYYMSKIEISLYNYIETISYIAKLSGYDEMTGISYNDQGGPLRVDVGNYDDWGFWISAQTTLYLMRDNIYEFDLSDPNLNGITNPLGFYESDGTTPFSTGVSQIGTPGTDGAKLKFTVPSSGMPYFLKLKDSYHNERSITLTVNTNVPKAFKSYYVDNKSIFSKTEYRNDLSNSDNIYNYTIKSTGVEPSEISISELVRGDSYVFTGRANFRLLTAAGEYDSIGSPTDNTIVYNPSSTVVAALTTSKVRYDIPFDAPNTLYIGTKEIKVVNKTIVLQKDIGPITDTNHSITIPETVTFEGNDKKINLNATDFTGLFDLQGGTIQNLKALNVSFFRL